MVESSFKIDRAKDEEGFA